MAHRIGSMGERMARNMRHAGFAVVAACDPDPGAAAKLARLAPQARLVADAAELAADPAVRLPLYRDTPRAPSGSRPSGVRPREGGVLREAAGDRPRSGAGRGRSGRARAPRRGGQLPFASAPALASGLRSGELSGIEHVDIEVAFARWPRPQQETAHWLGRREEGGFVREALRRRRPAKGAAPPANPGPEAGTAILHILRVARRPRPCRPSP